MNAAVVAETVRRHISSIGYIAFVIFVALLGVLASMFNTPASLWPSWITLLSMITGAALIGPEFSSGTLQLIVSRPIRRAAYVTSRVAGVFVSITIVAIIGSAAEIVMRAVRDTLTLQPVVIALGCELLLAFLAISILAFLGSVTRAYYNIAIYIGLQAAVAIAQAFLVMLQVGQNAIGELLRGYPLVDMLVAIDETFFPSIPSQPSAMWAIRIAATAVVFVALACLAFDRREVPYSSE